MHGGIQSDIDTFAKGGDLKTGYANIDSKTSLYPGLYVVGAIPSLGKTTFVHQMADQIAHSGHPVLFFSMEQSTLELASKSLSRTMVLDDTSTSLSSIQIRKNIDNTRIDHAMQQYESYVANHMTIIECTFQATIDDIIACTHNFISQNGRKPIVVIDYLQVIQPSADDKSSQRESTDKIIRRLKQLQSDNGIVLVAISSLNRQNYMTTIDFEAFKESGGIEYTADVIWGMQLNVIHDEIFDKQGQLNAKREKIREAKSHDIRKIELVCCKNRFGSSSYSCLFDYYPKYDLFRPIA